jgi:hypothetical protein
MFENFSYASETPRAVVMFENFSDAPETPRTTLPLVVELGLFFPGGRYFGCLGEAFRAWSFLLSFLLGFWLIISSLRCAPVLKDAFNFGEVKLLLSLELGKAPLYFLVDCCSNTPFVAADGGVLETAALGRREGGT